MRIELGADIDEMKSSLSFSNYNNNNRRDVDLEAANYNNNNSSEQVMN